MSELNFTRQELLSDMQVMTDAAWITQRLKRELPDSVTALADCWTGELNFDFAAWLEKRKQSCTLVDLFEDMEAVNDEELICMLRNYLEFCDKIE